MPSTYTPIASQTVTSPVASVTFSSIPQTYTDLIIVCNALATTSASVDFRFNGDTGSNYSYTILDSNGSALQANRQANTTNIQALGWSSNIGSTTNYSPAYIQIYNYTNTTSHKVALVRSTSYDTSSSCLDIFAGTWRNTAAINQITLRCANFQTNTMISLYGIKAA